MEGGERLLLQLGESFDPNNPNEMLSTHWLALDRQGIVTELYSTDSFATLEPAPGGYLIFGTTSKTLPATYTLEYNGEGGIETLLTLESDQYGALEIAYVPPSLPAEDLPPFTAITP